ncbi:hypothetical protein CL614_05765 [archaeon]|jgi:hypothetical protein|nr:hypothetical protein [archaeon]|tara:strand:+ start:779 stop:1213 length:435 start_codon:yes stop_codon:yes gene_type:complete
MDKLLIAVLIVIAVGVGGIFYQGLSSDDGGSFGSIITGQEYTSTTTPEIGGWVDTRIDGGTGDFSNQGALGSVVITAAGDVDYYLLDATTSLALSDVATNTVLIAHIVGSQAAGTYQFDAEFTTGLFLDVLSGNTGSSTITIRQ